MNGPIDGLLSTLDLTDTGARTTRGHLHRAVAVDAARPGLRRAGARAVARRRDAHRAGRPHHPLHARLLPAARRRAASDHVLGRPHPRRPLVLDAAHAGVPGRRADPLADRVVPDRTTRASSTRSTCRPTCPTPSRCRRRPTCSATSTTTSRATGRASARSTCGTSPRPSTSAVEGERVPRQAVWMKAFGRLPDDPNQHRAALAYASDYSILEPVLRAHGVAWATPGPQGREPRPRDVVAPRCARRRVAAVRAGVAVARAAGAGSRSAASTRRDGVLVASVAQEGMVRVPHAEASD